MTHGHPALHPKLHHVDGRHLRDALRDRLDPSASDLLGLVSDVVEFEFRYAPPGGTGRVEGRAALAAYLLGVARMVEIDSLTTTEVHATTDPDVTVLEFFATGRGTATGVPYD